MRLELFSKRTVGFSLIEVVLAIALLGLTIVAVIALLGTTSRSVTDVQDYTTAARISEAIQDEFERMGFDDLADPSFPLPIILYGNRSGDRVVLRDRVEPGFALFDSDERNAFPSRDWYYRIEVTRYDNQNYDNMDLWQRQLRRQNFSTFLPLLVEVRWPFNIPRGPGPDDAVAYENNRQRISIYYVSVRR